VKEVLINSFKKQQVPVAKPVNVAQLESIANSLEAPFHPENPEGSMIKELLLKTRVINLTSATTSPSNSSSPIRYLQRLLGARKLTLENLKLVWSKFST
jgi:hypothetical protein